MRWALREIRNPKEIRNPNKTVAAFSDFEWNRFELRQQANAVVASAGIGERPDVEITVGASGGICHDE